MHNFYDSIPRVIIIYSAFITVSYSVKSEQIPFILHVIVKQVILYRGTQTHCMWASLVPLVQNSVWWYTVFPLYIRENFVWGYTVFPLYIRENFVWGYTVFPLYIRENFVWGYTVFPLNNKGKFCVGVHSFSP